MGFFTIMARAWAFHESPAQAPGQPTVHPRKRRNHRPARLIPLVAVASRPSSPCHRRVCSGLRSDQRSFARPSMPLRRGIPVCAPQAPGGGLCGGGGSAPARCVLLSRTCFLWLPKKSGGVLRLVLGRCFLLPTWAGCSHGSLFLCALVYYK